MQSLKAASRLPVNATLNSRQSQMQVIVYRVIPLVSPAVMYLHTLALPVLLSKYWSITATANLHVRPAKTWLIMYVNKEQIHRYLDFN